MKPLFLCACAYIQVLYFTAMLYLSAFPNLACFPLSHVCNLPSCVLVLAHATGVRLLRSDTVQGVVSMTGGPGEHLERCCDPLIRVLLDSGSQQVTDNIFILVWLVGVWGFLFYLMLLSCITKLYVNSYVTCIRWVCSPLPLKGIEGFPESRADLTQQLD